MNKDLLDAIKKDLEDTGKLEQMREAIQQAQRRWTYMSEAERDKWREENLCPGCHKEGASRIGDNYGETCENCGYNWGYGEWKRQDWCNHVFSDIVDEETGEDQYEKEDPENTIVCIYCQNQFKNKEQAIEYDKQVALHTKEFEDYLWQEQEKEALR